MALKFFWRCEGTTLDGTHDFSAGDTTATEFHTTTAATISGTAAKLGSNGVLTAADSSHFRFDSASIVNKAVGCLGFWIQWKTVYPTSGLNCNGITLLNTADNADVIAVRTSGSDELKLMLRKTGTAAYFLYTTAANLALDNWYFIVGRWDFANDKAKLEVYNTSGTLIQSVEDTSTNLGPFEPSTIDQIRIGNSSGHDGATWVDNCFIANTYDEPIQNNKSITSYTSYNAGNAPTFTAGPSAGTPTTTSVPTTFTLDQSGTVYGVACPVGQAAPTVAQVKAGNCTGDVAAAAAFSETVVANTGDLHSLTGLASSTTYDLSFAGNSSNGDTAAISQVTNITTASATTGMGYAHGAVQWMNADSVNTTYTISGLTFQPKAIRLYWVGVQSSTDTIDTTHNQNTGMGFATSTSARRAICNFSEDAAAAANCGVMARNDCVACTTTGSGAAGGRVDLDAINSDGFRLIVDATTVSADITLFWEAWGGSDITVAVVGDIAEPAATGNQDYTATGLTSGGTDQIVMMAGCQSVQALNTGEAQDSGICVGVATNSSDQWVTAVNADDASATMDTDSYSKSGECLAMIIQGGGNPDAIATFVQYNTDGFRLNWTARGVTNRRYIFMAIKGGNWKVGETTINTTSTSNTATVSGLSFAPIGLFLLSSQGAEEASGTSQAQASIRMGSGTSPTSRRCMTVVDRNGVADAEIIMGIEYDQIFEDLNTDGTVASKLDIGSMNSDGFQLVVDTADATGNTAQWLGYITFAGASSVTAAPTFDTNPSIQSETASTYTIAYNADANATKIYVGAYLRGASAPTAAQVKAGTNAHGTNNATPTGGSDTVTLTPSESVKFPVYDIYCVLESSTDNFSVVFALEKKFLDPPTGKQFIEILSVDVTSPLFTASPAVVTGDVWVLDTVTTPDSYPITPLNDGNFQIDTGGDTSRQYFLHDVYDVSAGAYYG